MLILGADTSSKAATAALLEDGKIICEYTLNINNTHSEKFLPLIEQMLKDTSYSYDNIDVFACGLGPGSFTGIRIGVATIKGLCGALGKKAVGVSSLEALAYNAVGFSGIIVPTVFARADEVFCAAYEKDMKEIMSPSVMTIDELLDFCGDKEALFLGDGAEKFEPLIKQKSAAFTVAEHSLNIMRGSGVCALASKKAENNEFISYLELAPVYLRQSQAEREYNKNK